MQLSAYDTLEVIYLFRPLGVTLGERSVRNLKICCRDGKAEELSKLPLINGKLTLFVLTPQQFDLGSNGIQRLMEKNSGNDEVGFMIVEDPAHRSTIRQRKRFQQVSVSSWVVADLRAPYTFNQVMNEINKATHHLFLNANQALFGSMVAIREVESKAINEVGLAMTSQSTVDELMRLILDKAIELSTADAGFLVLRENMMSAPTSSDENTVKLLRNSGGKFVQKARSCKSQNVKMSSVMFDPQKSAFTSFIVNKACGVSWAEGMEFPIFRRMNYGNNEVQIPFPELEFDERNYYIKSYCSFPLRTPTEEVVGFIVLVNRRSSPAIFLDSREDIQHHVSQFTSFDLNILEAMANQAGVSLDHTRLIEDLKTVFESFVQASVVAIESRDPTTKGHSERVGILTVALAEAVNQIHTGPYANISFNPSQLYEIKYAALLHDFGKIGVREDVLRKERKLYHHELLVIRERFHMLEKQLHLKCLEAYLEGLMKKGLPPTQEDITRIQVEVDKISADLGQFWEVIVESNEPHVVSSGNFQKITEIAAVRVLLGNEQSDLLVPSELSRLTIRKGSLSPQERLEIESHVTHSYRFLINIPWTSDLANIPDIVYAHHERLDGSGYPRNLLSDEIPIQAKIMAITDIYDALVAQDRPYKKAIPHERALSILEAEVKDGKLDRDLFQLFVDARICDSVINKTPKVA